MTTRSRALNWLILLTAAVTLAATWIALTDAWPWIRGSGQWLPEWRWLYAPLGWGRPGRLLVHTGLLLGYGLAVAYFTWPPLRSAKPALLVAVLFLFLWQLVQTWVREESLLDTFIFRTYAPSLNGYFRVPAQAESISWVLHHYVEVMPTFFGDKFQTHPPGLFLFYAFFQELFERLPGLTGWFAPIARIWAIPGRDWPQLADPLITAAFVTGWIQTGLTALAPVGGYFFARRLRTPSEETNRELARWFALALPLLPPLTLLYLQWDILYPGLGLLAWGFALRGQNRLADVYYEGWGQWLDWLWAGLILSLLTWMSYGNLVWGLLIGLHVLWREGVAWREARARFDPVLLLPLLAGLALMGLGVALPWLAAYALWGMDFFAIMRQALDTHYAIVTAHRSDVAWMWMNLVDFTLWLGPAPLILGLAGSLALWIRARRNHRWRDAAGLAAIYWLVFILLLSNAARWELAWLLLTPFPLLFAFTLPWEHRQRLAVLGLLLLWGWTVAYSLAPVVSLAR